MAKAKAAMPGTKVVGRPIGRRVQAVLGVLLMETLDWQRVAGGTPAPQCFIYKTCRDLPSQS